MPIPGDNIHKEYFREGRSNIRENRNDNKAY